MSTTAGIKHDTAIGLAGWLKRLSDRDMPVLGSTVSGLCQASDERSTSAGDVAAIVLQDAAMTSRVLKLANSAYFNPGGNEISTISRAVVMLGFQTVRSIGLSVAIIDTFLRGQPKTRIVNLMRQAVYAAVQAKAIARHARDPAPEEIFIAALLYRLGEIAVWTFADDGEAAALSDALARTENPAQAELDVLGCTTRRLTLELVREWRLSDVLQDALQPAGGRGRSVSVLLGHELEAAVRRHGWESAAVRAITDRIAASLKVPPERARELITGSRRELEKAAAAFGLVLDLETGAADAASAAPAQPARAPDPLLQLKILREVAAALEKKPDLQLILDMVMEGIYRGIAMDRVLLAVLSPDRRSLRVKYALGDSNDALAQSFAVDLAAPEAQWLRASLDSQGARWHDGSAALGLAAHRAESFFIAPLAVRGRQIGLIYADCQPSHRPLDSEAFQAFEHFITQANISLEHLTRGR